MSDFKGKVVLVTGASSGIGAEVARLFAQQQARLSIVARNAERLNKVAEECRKLGAEGVLVVIADLSKENEAEKIVKETIERFEKLDILINNAGVGISASVENVTGNDFDKAFDVNVKAVVLVTKHVIPYLEKTKDGAKAYFPSPEIKAQYDAFSSSRHPLGGQNLTVQEIGDAVLYLASERAKMITGICLFVH
ncbi:unnamed protein product [Clavelina lepadiformis]|uniref:Uncharacterized protein n=1 Tax=Clavelina lepadiformis TaxID=159417 RepID=A0ABP0FEZ1_CLALP